MSTARALFIFKFLLLALAGCTNQSAGPNLIPTTDDMPCERHPAAFLVGEKIDNKETCNASAKIQAIAYECGPSSETLSFTQSSLKGNIKKAQIKCDEFCKNVSLLCHGVLSRIYECGLKSPPAIALKFGTNEMHCPKTCRGQAFNYCSIYHGPFFTGTDRSLFTGMPDNCDCRK